MPFHCQQMCDGQPCEDNTELDMIDLDPVPGVHNSGTCEGPFACNIMLCTMQSKYNDISAESDYQVPQACLVTGSPGEVITFQVTLLMSTDPFFHQRMQELCQFCTACGDSSLNNNRIPGYGLGCAAECTCPVCEELGTIYNWTDRYPEYNVALAERAIMDQCKSCDNLRDVQLCGALDDRFAASAVSGNQPLLRFD